MAGMVRLIGLYCHTCMYNSCAHVNVCVQVLLQALAQAQQGQGLRLLGAGALRFALFGAVHEVHAS